MRIAVTGGTGFIGKHLVRYLLDLGHEVAVISRSASHGPWGVPAATWKQLQENPGALGHVDGIVNLAGESINQRWSEAAKRRILDSRLEAAARVSEWVERLDRKPEVVVNGSGMSIYGVSETETFDEASPHRVMDFLSGVVEQWEEAADRIRGVRLVKLRIGLVLDSEGGALPKMALPYKLGVGGKVGSGRQWNSWIHIRDMVRLIEFCLTHGEVQGPINATAPGPVRNDDFGRALGRALGRPHWMPVPSLAFKLLFGELSSLLLTGQKVLPAAALKYGFRFEYPDLDSALKDLYKC